MKLVLIQSSLNPQSRTAIVIEETEQVLKDKRIDCETIDLRNLDMQFCDGRDLEQYNDAMQQAYAQLDAADGYIIGMPVYQYSVSGVLKNFLDIVMHAMKEKAVGIIANSGGVRSYLAAAELMKMLSFEVSAVSVQPIVHTWAQDFADGKLTNEDIKPRIEKMVAALMSQIS